MLIRSFYAFDLLHPGYVLSPAAVAFFNLDIVLSVELDSKREEVGGGGVKNNKMGKKREEKKATPAGLQEF